MRENGAFEGPFAGFGACLGYHSATLEQLTTVWGIMKTSLALCVVLSLAIAAAPALARPLLHCEVTYAGSNHVIEVAPGSDPYLTKSVDIDGRFRFKAVVLGAAERIDAIKLYAYYETRRQPILIQEMKLLPPFAVSDQPDSLTGRQYLYAPPLGRELQYGCALLEAKS
jgi:hypothetical protein